jgi:ribosomal protein S15
VYWPALSNIILTSIVCLRPVAKPTVPNFLPITQTANLSQREKKRKAKQHPYAWAQAQQRKNANLKRQEELKQERRIEGDDDPVRGRTTAFLESLENPELAASGIKGRPTTERRNFRLTDAELKDVMQHAYVLNKPIHHSVADGTAMAGSVFHSENAEELFAEHERKHNRASEALKRITAMENANQKNRYYHNVHRIVEEFGRHRTDKVLNKLPKNPEPPVEANMKARVLSSIWDAMRPLSIQPPLVRAGPDTGSSEVQIGLLTARIRRLDDVLRTNRGYKDIQNKRALEMLVHKRQKLLKYMERKERGSERWTNMLDKLGLTPASWKGQISTYGRI